MAEHDQRFKVLLQEFFGEFLRLFFATWAERFDLSQVEWLDKEVFTDPPLGESRLLDLVARARTTMSPTLTPTDEADRWLVLVHIEVESGESVAGLHARMFDYWWHLRNKFRQPVLPIGLYLRVGFEGTGWVEHREHLWEEELARFRYAYIGLPALNAFDFVKGPNLLGAALAALMDVPAEQRALLKAEAAQRVAASKENDYRKGLLAECIDAYLTLEGTEQEAYDRLLSSQPYEEARTMAQTTFEKGVQKGLEMAQTTFDKGAQKGFEMAQTTFEKGFQKGLEIALARFEEGVQKGFEMAKATGAREVILDQVESRFGPLSENVRQQIDALPEDRLRALAKSILTATSLRDLGLIDESAPS
jgi:hypothetical protein